MIEPGEFRHRVQLVADVGTIAGLQGPIPDEQIRATPWAKIEPLRGGEYWRANQSESSATHRIVLRWRPDFDVTTRMAILHGERRFDIDEVLNVDERNHTLELLAHEHEPAA